MEDTDARPLRGAAAETSDSRDADSDSDASVLLERGEAPPSRRRLGGNRLSAGVYERLPAAVLGGCLCGRPARFLWSALDLEALLVTRTAPCCVDRRADRTLASGSAFRYDSNAASRASVAFFETPGPAVTTKSREIGTLELGFLLAAAGAFVFFWSVVVALVAGAAAAPGCPDAGADAVCAAALVAGPTVAGPRLGLVDCRCLPGGGLAPAPHTPCVPGTAAGDECASGATCCPDGEGDCTRRAPEVCAVRAVYDVTADIELAAPRVPEVGIHTLRHRETFANRTAAESRAREIAAAAAADPSPPCCVSPDGDRIAPGECERTSAGHRVACWTLGAAGWMAVVGLGLIAASGLFFVVRQVVWAALFGRVWRKYLELRAAEDRQGSPRELEMADRAAVPAALRRVADRFAERS